MAKTWVLDTETKGTGANVVPLDTVVEKARAKPRPATRKRKRPTRPDAAPRRAKPSQRRTETSVGPLPPGHVRKKATGELGRVQSVDPKAGTATVLWLRQGRTSTVPLTAISRR